MTFEAFAAEEFCYLTTTGRVSERPRTIEIWFALEGATLFMLSGNREDADWVKNATHDPRVHIAIRGVVLSAQARRTRNDAEEVLARRLLYEKYALTEARATESLSLEEWARTALPIAFDLMWPPTPR